MGVSMEWRPATGRKWRYINVGWRSMLYNLLLDRGLLGGLDAGDVEALQEVAITQNKGVRAPPFDWSQDIHDAIMGIVKAIERHKNVEVRGEW